MAGEIGGEGAASGGTMEALIDPLLQSFAERYVHPWERRELGRIDSPLYLVPQLNDAAELFERGRQRWRTLDVLSKGGAPRGDVLRDFDGKEWAARRVKAARDAHRLLLTHSSFDISKPDDLSVLELRELVGGDVPAAALYASVAMRCSQDAADECYRLARLVEDCALRWRGVELAALHDADNDEWFDRIRDVLRDLAGEVAEAREYIATYLGAAGTALALASAAENAENLNAAERDYVDLWEKNEATLSELGPELAEKAELKKANLKLVADQAARLSKGPRANADRAAKTRESVRDLWFKYSDENPSWGTTKVCERIAADIKSPLADRKNAPMSTSSIEKMIGRMKRVGLLVRKAGQLSDEPERETTKSK